jgi:hypothetical protein
MMQGYTLRLNRGSDLPPLLYHGIVTADGESIDTRTEDELSGKATNRRFKAALEEYGRYAFEVIWTTNYNSKKEAILCEKERIARDDTTHPDKGLNIEPWDKKRWKKAEAEDTPGASFKDEFNAILTLFKRDFADDWAPYDCPENETVLWEIVQKMLKAKETCTVTGAFEQALEAGTLTPRSAAE